MKFNILDISHRLSPYRKVYLTLIFLIILKGLLEATAALALIPLFDQTLGIQSQLPLLEKVNSLTGLNLSEQPNFVFTVLLSLIIFEALVLLIYHYTSFYFSGLYQRDTRNKLVKRIIGLNWLSFTRHKSGRLINSVTNEVTLSRQFIQNLAQLFEASISVAIYLLGTILIASYYVLGILILGAAIAVILKPFVKKIKKLGIRQVEASGAVVHNINEILFGMKAVKASGINQASYSKLFASTEEQRSIALWAGFLKKAPSVILKPVSVILTVSILYLLKKYNITSVSELAVLGLLLLRIMQKLMGLQSQWMRVVGALPSFNHVNELCDSLSEKKEQSAGQVLTDFQSLEFKDVSFSYNDNLNTLSNINLTINKGDYIAFIGESGAGKTTLMDIILMLLRPQYGQILFNGVNINKLNVKSIRKLIGFVPQECVMFHDSIKNNIALGQANVDDNTVIDSAHKAHAHEFIINSKSGYDTIIGDRGMKVSGGQKQRLAFARALARKPQVLLLDEATSALDSESELMIQKALEEQKGYLTIIAIAHRLSTIMNADKVVVLKKGRIVEIGNPQKLIKDDSLFKKMWNSQTAKDTGEMN